MLAYSNDSLLWRQFVSQSVLLAERHTVYLDSIVAGHMHYSDLIMT